MKTKKRKTAKRQSRADANWARAEEFFARNPMALPPRVISTRRREK